MTGAGAGAFDAAVAAAISSAIMAVRFAMVNVAMAIGCDDFFFFFSDLRVQLGLLSCTCLAVCPLWAFLKEFCCYIFFFIEVC